MNIARYTEVIWRGGQMSSHESEDAAKKKAKKLSKDEGTVYAISYAGSEAMHGWSFADGRATNIASEELPALVERLQATLVEAPPAPTEEEPATLPIESEPTDDGNVAVSEPNTTSESDMPVTKKTTKKTAKRAAAPSTARKATSKRTTRATSKAAAKAASKRTTATKAAAKTATKAATKAPVNGAQVRFVTAEVAAAIGSRPDTIRAGVLRKLTEKLGEPVGIKKLLTAGYGSNYTELNRANINAVLNGIKESIERNSIPVKLERVKVGDDIGYAIKKA